MADDGERVKRFFKDLADFEKVHDFAVTNYDEVECRWVTISFAGVEDTPFGGGQFDIKIFLKNDFPMSAPKVKFTTELFHPNVGLDGRVCMSVISEWSPGTKLVEVAEACRALLIMPNAASPLNGDAAYMLNNYPYLWAQTSQYYVAVFANGPTRPENLQSLVHDAMEGSIRTEERCLQILARNMWHLS